MSASLSLAVCQFAPGADPAANREEVADLVVKAAHAGAKLVLFPEYSNYFVAPFDESIREFSEPIDGDFILHLRTLAEVHDVTIVCGFLEAIADEDRPYNTAVAVNAGGVIASYRKQHLYDAFGNVESDWIAPGALGAPETFELGGFTIGMITCYDLRFPEAMRVVVDAGADVVLAPAEWVKGPLKERHWNTLISARAIENTVFVAAADHPMPVAVGFSQIVAPDGTMLAGTSSEAGMAVATLRGDDLGRVRGVNPALTLRRYRVSAAE